MVPPMSKSAVQAAMDAIFRKCGNVTTLCEVLDTCLDTLFSI